MIECPELGVLERVPLEPPISAHVAACTACRMVVEVFATATGAGEADCLRFDGLLAGRVDGTLNPAGTNLLARHLARCGACRAVAETLSPTADKDGDLAALPQVDPSGYAIGLEVARGGMGRILAARDLRVGRPVAVKELLGRSPTLAARFEREARVTARLQHPGIVPIYEIGRWPDGTPFYSMRMVEGCTLLEAIDAAPTLAARLALLPAVIAATEAVAFAHGKRVIHRDLTPSNVLVGAYGETVVIDWGLAKDLSEDNPPVDGDPYRAPEASGENLTGVGAVIGTAAYMPPEQAHAVPVDERADVYALGSILYHLLAGVAPYRAKSTRALLRDVKVGPPPPVGELAPGAPRDLVSIVTKAMARDPEGRYRTARELTEELKRFQTGRMVEAHAYSQADRIRRFVRRNQGVLAVTALAVLLLGVGGAVAVSRVLRSRGVARDTVRELLVEEGRVELLDGNLLRGLAYLDEAYKQGITSDSLGLLIERARRSLPRSEVVRDCDGDVTSVEFSRDGSHVIAACHDVAWMWSATNDDAGDKPLTLGPIAAGFERAAFSREGGRILTWGDDGIARLWNAKTGQPGGEFAHGAAINVAMLTPDERRLVTFGQDGTVQVFTVATGSRERTIVAATGLLRHIYGTISSDGSKLFTLNMDGEGKGWDLDTGAYLGGFRHGERALLLGADIAADGTHAATCGTDRLTKILDTATGANVRTLGGHSGIVWKCMFSPDGTRLLTAGDDETALIWDLTTGATVTSVNHGDIVLWARFSPDGRRFFTVGVDGIVKVWDVGTGAQLASHDSIGGKDARFSPDGTKLAARRGDGRIQIWNEGPSLPTSFTPAEGASVLAVSGDGMHTAIEDRDGWVHLHDTATGLAGSHVEIHAPVTMSVEGRIAAMSDRAVMILDVATGKTLHTIPQSSPVADLELSADGHRLVITRPAAAPEIWDVDTAVRIAVIPDATHAKSSRSGRRVLAWRDDEHEHPFVWDVDDRQRLATLDVPHSFQTIGFSGDGNRIALLERDLRRVTLWDAEVTGEPLRTTLDTSIAPTFDPTGTWLTTIGIDRVVTIWDARDGSSKTQLVAEQLLQAEANKDATLIAGIGDNGTSLIVLSVDGRLLERIPIEHRPPMVSQLGFQPPFARAGWSNRGDAIVVQSTSIAVVPAGTTIDAPALQALIEASVPWRVDRGKLVGIDEVHLHGHVTDGAHAIANPTVVVEIRTPAHPGATPIDTLTMRMTVEDVPAITRGDGTFELARQVPPGIYKITTRKGERSRSVDVTLGTKETDVTITLPP